MNKPYENKRYFGMALDPIHIGTGGYRLGRVDNTIARDAATNLPIIFGSSIEGTARTYAYYQGVRMKEENKDSDGIYKNMTKGCAGKGDPTKEKLQCGTCAVCVTFGYTEAKNGKSLHGMAQFSDAKILFFPVHTMIGPVWVTTGEILKEVGLNNFEVPSKKEEVVISNQIQGNHGPERLNLGWLYLNTKGDNNQNLTNDFTQIQLLGNNEITAKILERIVVVHNDIFHQIVNSNLEVRTSVSIDPQTGAAEERALFTYEAIPRSTVMYFDVVYNNPEHFDLNHVKFKDNGGNDRKPQLSDIQNTVKKGLCLFEHLGIGGMGTRGFGRFKILNLECGGNDNSNNE
ncbi:MAG: type III-B CRISPR module RAMP protein Cmr4 [Candidatus Methanofastidiosia archaeon]